jgi:hypothetical protein
MESDLKFACVIAVAALVLSAAGPASAQSAAAAGAPAATFVQIRDAVPGKFFAAAKTDPDPTNPNRLVIGFNDGIDVATFTSRDFSVNTAAFGNRVAADTIRFVVKAPDGYYVSKITYLQRGSASTARTAQQAGTAEWTVAGFPANLGVFSGNPDLTGVADLTSLQRVSVPVSITVSLFAGPTGSMSVNKASVLAELAPLPLP